MTGARGRGDTEATITGARTPGFTSHTARPPGISATVDPPAKADFTPISRAELASILTFPEVRSDPKLKGKEERAGQGPDQRALERRLVVNCRVFDELIEDHSGTGAWIDGQLG